MTRDRDKRKSGSREGGVSGASKRRKRQQAPKPAPATVPSDGQAGAASGTQIEHGQRPRAVYEQLRELIVRGRLAPGTPLIETDIADRLRVSRTPVRSALQRLHQEWLISEVSGQRAFKFAVAPLTREDARSLFHIMAELDGLAAYYAATHPDKERERLVRALRVVNVQLRATANAGQVDPSKYYELDAAFHQQYVEAGADPRLLALREGVERQVDRYWRIYAVLLSDRMATSAHEHDQIIEALARGDENAAQQAARSNWRNSAARLMRAIEQMGERGSW